MDDLISRAAAIEALSTPCDKRYRHGVWETCLDNIETAIRNIPAVDAVPVVHGLWIDIPDKPEWDQKMCSVCGDYFCCQNNYCPNCGAKMDMEVSE